MEKSRIEEIMGEALSWPPEERAERLTAACGGDEAMRREVESLLEAHAAAGSFMAAPSVEAVGSGPLEGAGSVLGRYKLLQLIGEGGFGSVYMAEQRTPIRRRVAVKIIKLGMDTKQVIARFEAERQALAMMDHPSIARVLDAGSTESGRPFFVMELVRGVPITGFCDRERLTIPQRLGLFRDLCAAVHHAHQKGVIHRDLKPSNILVAEVDGRALPKIIDFGIAKATAGGGAPLTDKTLFTDFRQFVGTPEYMSPEQAGRGTDIDTRSDIYSLGVLLYELVTGAPPFDAASLRSAAWEEMRRIIREDEPPPPSTRLGSHEESSSVAARRRVEPGALCSMVRGDLDWVVMKSLEKDRSRRYESADALGADIGRHVEGHPVEAAPPSTAYRVRKFVGRHRVPVAAGALVALSALLGAAGVTAGLLRAIEAEAVARRRADQLSELNSFLGSQLSDLDEILYRDRTGAGRELTYPRMLDVAEQRERVLGPEHRLTISSLRLLGRASIELGEIDEGERVLRRASSRARRVLREDDPLLYHTLKTHGRSLRLLGRLDEAAKVGAESVRLLRSAQAGEPGARRLDWGVYDRYGLTLLDMGRFEEAEEMFLASKKLRDEQIGLTRYGGKPVMYLIEVYDAWHEAEPDAGHDVRAAEWRAYFKEPRSGEPAPPGPDD